MWFFKKRRNLILEKRKKALFDKITKLLGEKLEIPPEKITLSTHFVKDLGFDSLDTVEATIALEEAFGMEIPDEDIEKITDVGELVEYLYKRRYG